MSMTIVYVPGNPPETFKNSIFLAGPSPRDSSHPNWRPEALKLLEEIGYDGVVFIPLVENGDWRHGYDAQIEWEKRFLDMADVIVFWVPRDMKKLPALTTNVEFGMYFNSGKSILGYPVEAPHMRYLDSHARKEGVPVIHNLHDTLQAAVNRIGSGAERTGGEREVPLHIWKTPQFQAWLQAQKNAGNRLDGAKLIWNFRVGPKKDFLFCFALRVNVHVVSEGRNKVNEFIISRPDISTIVAYARPMMTGSMVEDTNYYLLNTQIAIVREFRSPASVGDCFIREVPGGSSYKPGTDPLVTAAHELSEETGFFVEAQRLKFLGARQVAGTFSTHLAHVFACEITPKEIALLQSQKGIAHGVVEDTERTYVEVYTVRQLLEKPLTDWANLGMILSTLLM